MARSQFCQWVPILILGCPSHFLSHWVASRQSCAAGASIQHPCAWAPSSVHRPCCTPPWASFFLPKIYSLGYISRIIQNVRDICWGWNVSSSLINPYCFDTRKTNQFPPSPSAHILLETWTKLIAGTSGTRGLEKKNPKPCSITLTAFHVLWGFHLQWLWIKVSDTQNLMPVLFCSFHAGDVHLTSAKIHVKASIH